MINPMKIPQKDIFPIYVMEELYHPYEIKSGKELRRERRMERRKKRKKKSIFQRNKLK
jgi:hypothetical protein